MGSNMRCSGQHDFPATPCHRLAQTSCQMWPCRMDDEGGPVTVSYGRRESFVLADDMSDFFGTQRSIDGTSA